MLPHITPCVLPNLDASVGGLSDPAEAAALIQNQLEVQPAAQEL